jgi:hypothetical protein
LTIRKFWGLFTPQTLQRHIYVGTNQGLFYKKYQTSDEFKFISGTKGQVWSLFEDGTLFAVMTGTFVIENAMQKNIFSFRNVKFETVQSKRTYYFKNYYGLSVLSK